MPTSFTLDERLIQRVRELLEQKLSNRLIAEELNKESFPSPAGFRFHPTLVSLIVNQEATLKAIRTATPHREIRSSVAVSGDKQKQIVSLFLQGKAVREIAKDVDCSTSSVYGKLRDAAKENLEVRERVEAILGPLAPPVNKKGNHKRVARRVTSVEVLRMINLLRAGKSYKQIGAITNRAPQTVYGKLQKAAETDVKVREMMMFRSEQFHLF
jgi:DNA-binding CsgD family transcriptional regulator